MGNGLNICLTVCTIKHVMFPHQVSFPYLKELPNASLSTNLGVTEANREPQVCVFKPIFLKYDFIDF